MEDNSKIIMRCELGDCNGRLKVVKTDNVLMEIAKKKIYERRPICKATGKVCDGRRVIDHGYCIDWCKVCNGLGVVRIDVERDHADFGKTKTCPNMPFEKMNLVDTGLDPSERSLKWSGMKPSKTVDEMRSRTRKVLNDGYGMLYLYGRPGNGKTTAAKISMIEALTQGMSVKYTTHRDMINYLRASYDIGNYSSQQEFIHRQERICKVDFLVIDELARDTKTEFSIATTSKILDRRYVMATREEAITILISNFKPEDALDDYQVDRVRDGRFVVYQAEGISIRPAMGEKK